MGSNTRRRQRTAKVTKAEREAADAAKHEGHVAIDQVAWNEATGKHHHFRLCSCGAKRALEG